MNKVKALIPTGLGFNCEYESAKAFELAHAKADIVDLRDIISGEVNLFDYHILMIIGGFSFGDDLGSGKAIANLLRFKKIKGKRFIDLIKEFVLEQKKVVFGVCNGFQVLIKLGILPAFDKNYEEQNCTLTLNNSGRYEDRWIKLKFNSKSPCIATKGLEFMNVPVRHGEGKFIAENRDVLNRVMDNNHFFAQYIDPETNLATMKYPLNPNGAVNSVAGICDETGRVIGMMPHPEANLLFETHPHWTRLKRKLKDQGKEIPKFGEGLKIFKNIVKYCEENCI
ncbi:phosphoribosylformylglycinamidine synthase subunit PurQ [Candidatus Woesearchaeota archaeon]|nr:phosphoribosylformylglycinamidine synthase subunit PurQ [Candidatus Woesearchaeota archaeon]